MMPWRLIARASHCGSAETLTTHQGKFPIFPKQGCCERVWPFGASGLAYRLGRLAGTLLLVATALLETGCDRGTTPDPEVKILFTQVPQATPGDKNEQDVMEGTISGTRPGQRLVLYSKIGGLWWLQPLLTSPFTAIFSNGVWRNEMHLGTDYAVLLVDSSYIPTAVMNELPKRGEGIRAVAETPGQEKSSSFFVEFSGFTWRVRWRPSDRGGTNNLYKPENVFTDKAGALHLNIIEREGRWTCSEVNLTRSLGYGTYSFTVEDTSGLEPAAVFAMFVWDFSTDQENHREFDLDIGRWGNPNNKNAEFALQPKSVPVNISRFIAPAGKLRHILEWRPGKITMTTSRVSGGLRDAIVSQHVFTSEVPTSGSESVRMSLFLYSDPNGQSLGSTHRAEVVVDQFAFLP